jgi:hypothetical protein
MSVEEEGQPDHRTEATTWFSLERSRVAQTYSVSNLFDMHEPRTVRMKALTGRLEARDRADTPAIVWRLRAGKNWQRVATVTTRLRRSSE